ncbi:MAG: hypothetical protein FWE24_11595 [Defluviitaleaceae bacterium]|nr:hypothetical protein [Defluviitaleaceae bacterium]
MELFKEILAKILKNEEIHIIFPNLEVEITAKLVEMQSFKALQKIQAIIENDDLSDFHCIEEIILVLEEMGTGCNRNDWYFD